MLKISDSLISSCDITDKMAASIESYCEMYKRPYLPDRSTDLHKIYSKMFIFLTLFNEVRVKICGPSL